MPDPDAAVTVRHLITALTESASRLPAGLDTPVRFGLCDGTDLHLHTDVGVDTYTALPKDPAGDTERFLLVRAHQHPDSPAGQVWRGAASHADDELRRLTGDDP